MKIVIASYFFPPAQVVASERWRNFSDELKKNHQVTVFAGPWDKTSSGDVIYIKDPFSEDGARLKTLAPAVSSKWRRWIQSLGPGFILIDGKWLWSLKVFFKILWFAKFDLLIITGTPWSAVPLLTLAGKLRRIPVVLDFRDPWATEATSRYSSSWAQAYFGLLQSWSLRNAKLLITVSDELLSRLKKDSAQLKGLVLPNGLKEKIIWSEPDFNSVEQKKTSFIYAGTVTAYHGMNEFLELAELIFKAEEIKLWGSDHTQQCQSYKCIKIEGNISAIEAAEKISDSVVSILVLAKERGEFSISGKIMTYIQCGRPILYFGPDRSPAAEIIRKYDLGWIATDKDSLQEAYNEISDRIKSRKSFEFHPKIEDLNSKFYRQELVKGLNRELADCFSNSKTLNKQSIESSTNPL